MFLSRHTVAVTAFTCALALVPAAVTVADNGSDPPTVLTRDATAVDTDRATFQGKVDPVAHDTTYQFEYGTTTAYGQSTPVQSAGNGEGWVSVAQPVTGLAPSTSYHFRVVATNEHGTSHGGDKTFTTYAGSAPPPVDPGDGGGGNAGTGNGGSNNDSPGNPGSGASGSDPARDKDEKPKLGETVGVSPADGVVRIRKPQDKGFGAIEPGGTVPSGSVIDARFGKVALTTALPDGAVQTGTFWGGVFEVRQSREGRGYADLYLRGRKPRGCPKSARRGRASASAKRRRGASLWGRDRVGKFRTHGRNSVATVRGTKWLTTERCDGTLTVVRDGVVDVRRKGGRTVRIRAGHAFLARPRR